MLIKKSKIKQLILMMISFSMIIYNAYAIDTGSTEQIVSANTKSLGTDKLDIKSVYSTSANDKSKFNVECMNGITYSFESLGTNSSKVLLNEKKSVISSNIVEINRTYLDSNNNTTSDIVTITRSSSGSDIVTRQSQISNFTIVEITASFDWYTSGLFSYVRCSGMSACYTQHTNLGCSRFTKSQSDGYVSVGSAYAQVSYYFYNTQIPVQYQEGTFKITCTDSGTISDNGY